MESMKKEELRYHHFSHDHLLDYTKLQPHGHATCSGCRQIILHGKFYYKCKLCGFYLHQTCFNMPENVKHPSDPNHNLTLETFPTLSNLPITCKACENPIKGFYYRCSKCNEYYHTLCLAAPISMKTHLHRHSLNVEFVPVYDFRCDLCDKPSYSGWVYHCNLCEFDAHLSCVLTNKGSVQLPIQSSVGNQQRDELIELLTRGSDSNPPVDHHQDQPKLLLSGDQDHAVQSFQLSETCFSIDFQNSLLGDGDKIMQEGHGGGVREVAIPEDSKMYGSTDDGDSQQQVFEESRRSERSRSSSYGQKSSSVSSSGIGAHIWTELEEATEKRNSKPRDTRVESNTGRTGSSRPNFMCCFHIGKISS